MEAALSPPQAYPGLTPTPARCFLERTGDDQRDRTTPQLGPRAPGGGQVRDGAPEVVAGHAGSHPAGHRPTELRREKVVRGQLEKGRWRLASRDPSLAARPSSVPTTIMSVEAETARTKTIAMPEEEASHCASAMDCPSRASSLAAIQSSPPFSDRRHLRGRTSATPLRLLRPTRPWADDEQDLSGLGVSMEAEPSAGDGRKSSGLGSSSHGFDETRDPPCVATYQGCPHPLRRW